MEYTIKRKDWREGVQRTQINIKLHKVREIGFNMDIIYCFFLTQLMENCDDDLIEKVVELTDAGTDDGFSFKGYSKWWWSNLLTDWHQRELRIYFIYILN